jgi:glycosyltransferase involved in cell wall biosynthesis
MLLKDDKMRTEMGQNGYDYIKREFEWDRLIEKEAKIMMDLSHKMG